VGGTYENHQNQSTQKKIPIDSDAAGMSMESMDFGLSESNFSGANFTQIKSFTPHNKAQTAIAEKKTALENDDDYSDTFE
jgi:hypothetical protein